jgi:hypothetical protein
MIEINQQREISTQQNGTERWLVRLGGGRYLRFVCWNTAKELRALAANTAGQLNILGHDCHTLGVDSAQVGIFEKTNKVSFGGLLKGKDGGTLETKIRLEILSNLTDKTLERELADEQVSGLLVTTNLTKGDRSRAVTVGLLHTSGGRGRLAGSLGGELLTRSLSSGGLASGLLGTGHVECRVEKVMWLVAAFVLLLLLLRTSL